MSEVSIAVTRTYSVRLSHVGKVTDLADRFGVSQGSVVRAAIDLLWKVVEDGAVIVDDVVRLPQEQAEQEGMEA